MKEKNLSYRLLFVFMLCLAGSCTRMTSLQKKEQAMFDPPRKGATLKEQRRFEQYHQEDKACQMKRKRNKRR